MCCWALVCPLHLGTQLQVHLAFSVGPPSLSPASSGRFPQLSQDNLLPQTELRSGPELPVDPRGLGTAVGGRGLGAGQRVPCLWTLGAGHED